MNENASSQVEQGVEEWPIEPRFLGRNLLFTGLMNWNSLTRAVQHCRVQLGSSTDTAHMWHFKAETAANSDENRILDRDVDTIVALALEENIEDGMNSETASQINRFISCNSVAGVQRLATRLISDHTNAVVAADIVRVLGRNVHKDSHHERLWIAERLLQSDSPLTRDASAVALEELMDLHAIAALQDAVEVESIPELKADIEMALQELKKNADGVHSQEA